MTTRIDTYAATAAASVRSTAKSADASSQASSSESPVSNVAPIDSAKFTSNAIQLQQLESSMAKTPVSDNQKVAKVRAAIASDSYKVDTKTVAKKLARMEWDISRK